MPLQKVTNGYVIWFVLGKTETEKETVVEFEIPRVNAFQKLMSGQKKTLPKIETATAKDILYNDVVDISLQLKMQFNLQDFPNAKLLIQCITNCLWHIDTNEEVMKNASKKMIYPNFSRTFM